jgi:hypothetical protein|tara:strand:+ start:1028 stop:1372 length:345 start_codon:yes stop_codon:yes gene_type:complete
LIESEPVIENVRKALNDGMEMSVNISMETKISSGKQILSSDIGDEMVMMDINLGKYFSLKGPSGRVWELIDKETSVQSIFDILLEEYDVEAEQCQKELFALLHDMHDAEMIVAI